MTTLLIPEELAAQIQHAARLAGEPETVFLSESVRLRLEDLEDLAIARERLAHPEGTISIEELSRNLGLDD